jgi:release factor glutamine methyltransferase
LKKAVKYLVTLFYKPVLAKYLSTTRTYHYKGIHMVIPPEVFHPGFFFSTKILLKYISRLPIEQKSLLELGAGSGLIALYTAKTGAQVTATDINPVAISSLQINAGYNHLEVTVIHSDLFENIPAQQFDIIAINPPYFRKKPQSFRDYAWYCGEQGEYFERLFKTMGDYVHKSSSVFMILSDGCDLEMIKNYSAKYGWSMNCVKIKKNLVEELFLFSVNKVSKNDYKILQKENIA